MFKVDTAKTLDDMTAGFQRKLNMIGVQLDIKKFYTCMQHKLIDSEDELSIVSFEDMGIQLLSELASEATKIFGQGKERQLVLNQNMIRGRLSYFSNAFNVTTLLIDSESTYYIDTKLLQLSKIKHLVFLGNEKKNRGPKSDSIAKLARGNETLESIYFPDGLSYISADSIHSCSNLRLVSLPDTFKSYDTQAFQGCDKLNELHIRSIDKKSGKRIIKVHKLNANKIMMKDFTVLGFE